MSPERLAPPYFAQWESPRLIPAFLAGRLAETDPRWPLSGAATPEEYGRWAGHLCGMACLQMVMAARGEHFPIHALRRAVQGHGGYVERDGEIRGLIYAGAVAWLETQGIAASVELNVNVMRLRGLLRRGQFIASVDPSIRQPAEPPPGRGGHLVLVFGRDRLGALRFHNPSGDSLANRWDVRLSTADFFPFFSRRGIFIPC